MDSRNVVYMMRRALFLSAFFILVHNSIYAQGAFRRHFIIAYDVSGPFKLAEKNLPEYSISLQRLFANKSAIGFNEVTDDILQRERKAGVPFFDKNRDEISFFHFNIAESEFDHLRAISRVGINRQSEEAFQKAFLKKKGFGWSEFSRKHAGSSVDSYLAQALATIPQPLEFGNGVSMSNFVYPLVLDALDTTNYASEYILIILSDFKTGAMLGNTEDLRRVRDIYRVPYNVNVPANSVVASIKNRIDRLYTYCYKIEYFSFAFLAPQTQDRIGILGFKIKPRAGATSPEDIVLFVDSDLDLEQAGYQSETFKTAPTSLKFTHNKDIIPNELLMTVSRASGEELFSGIVATRDKAGVWTSKYTSENDLMRYDSVGHTYYLPSLTMAMGSGILERLNESIVLQFDIKSHYRVQNVRPLNLIFSTQRVVSPQNIHYSTKAIVIVMYYVLPLLLIGFVIIYLVYQGKPLRVSVRTKGYLDSFEKTDYKTFGKLVTAYKSWEGATDHLLFNGKLAFSSPSYKFNWKSTVYLRLHVATLPSGFDVYLKERTDDLKEFAADSIMPINIKNSNGDFSFYVGIRQNDVARRVDEPLLIKLMVEAAVKQSVLGIKTNIRTTYEYHFHIGPDLGDVWIGFDPGTSGSCMAVGSATSNIVMVEDIRAQSNRKIIPSLLTFDTSEDYISDRDSLSESIYRYGYGAYALYEMKTRYRTFQSIKKLLGYRDVQEVPFANTNCLQLKGKDIASLLVKGLYADVNNYVSSLSRIDDYAREGKFDPRRAVVAIPNNFTITKTQDMIECIDRLAQFKEIRYIYEAEAVLFYYLSDPGKFGSATSTTSDDTVLIFDMGGATINATVVIAEKTELNGNAKYNIDYLAKIGYGIGGDTIDYCICKFILNCSDEFPQLAEINISDHKIELSKLALELKKEFIYNYYKGANYLITAENLQNWINRALNVNITIPDAQEKDSDEYGNSKMYQYFLKKKGRFELFDHPLFVKIIYNNVRDAVNEVIRLSGNKHLDKIIFSGRSTSFPLIKETVESELKVKENKIATISLKLEESKTAVAWGACWYGINKNAIHLNNLKTNASFGFRRTLSTDRKDVQFSQLVKMGQTFDTTIDNVSSFEGVEQISSNFAFDGNKVDFFQVMGSDLNAILGTDERHKYSKIASIRIDQNSTKIGMKVNENDEVECVVQLESDRKLYEKGVVSDQEIDEANAEHYTWIVK